MKMKFDIKYRPEIESGKYRVETRFGRSARIVCWDRKDKDKPILALITDSEEHEFNNYYTVHGCADAKEKYQDKYDLFITDEKELTEFEKCLSHIIKEAAKEEDLDRNIHADSELLLRTAEKEFEKNLPKWKPIVGKLIYIPNGEKTGVVCDTLYDLDEKLEISVKELKKLPKEE